MKAFTITEILIVLAIVLAVSAVSLPLVGQRSFSAKIDSAKFILEQNLRLTKIKSQAYFQDSGYGIKFFADSYVLFRGSDYVSRQSADDVPVILDKGAILYWQLNGVGQGDEIVFASSTGHPSRYGRIDIFSGEASSSIYLNSRGIIE